MDDDSGDDKVMKVKKIAYGWKDIARRDRLLDVIGSHYSSRRSSVAEKVFKALHAPRYSESAADTFASSWKQIFGT